MKKGTFKGLLFREFYIARKNYGYNLIAYFTMAFIGLMALLSYECGNLNRYTHLINADLKNIIDAMIKFTPAFTGACFFGGASDATPNDEKTAWRRFRTASPVTPFRLALAKYVCLFLSLIISFALTFGWLGLYSLLTGTSLSKMDLGITVTIYAVSVLLIIYMQNIIIWVRTLERTIIVLMITSYSIIIPILLKNPELLTTEGLDKLKGFCIKLIPFTPLIIPIAFILGILCTTILYRRREK